MELTVVLGDAVGSGSVVAIGDKGGEVVESQVNPR